MKDLATRSGKLLNDFEIGIQNKNSRQRSYFNIHNLWLSNHFIYRGRLIRELKEGLKPRLHRENVSGFGIKTIRKLLNP